MADALASLIHVPFLLCLGRALAGPVEQIDALAFGAIPVIGLMGVLIMRLLRQPEAQN